MAFKALTVDEKAYGIYLRKIGKRLAKFRADAEMSRAELAKALDVTVVTIANWEAGKGVTMRTVYVYAKRFRTKASKILVEADV